MTPRERRQIRQMTRRLRSLSQAFGRLSPVLRDATSAMEGFAAEAKRIPRVRDMGIRTPLLINGEKE